MSTFSDFIKDLVGPLTGIGTAVGGGLATKGAYDRLQDIGEQAVLGTTVGDQLIPGTKQLASEALGLSQFRPFTVTSSTGSQFGVTPQVDPTTGVVTGTTVGTKLGGLEQDIQTELFRQANTGILGGTVGAPAAQDAGLALMGRGRTQLGQDPYGILNQQLLAQRSANLGGMFMGQVEAPLASREADIYNRIRATQMPEEQRQRLALEERLAGQGRLGVQTAMYGGTPEQFAMAQAQEEAQNRASLAAIQQAQAEQAQQATLGSQFLGASYVPQSQMLNVQQASQLFPELQQQAQLFGAGEYGETQMTGLEARLIAEQARANLLGNIGSGLLGGLFSPIAMDGGGIGTGIGSLFGIGKDLVSAIANTGSTS